MPFRELIVVYSETHTKQAEYVALAVSEQGVEGADNCVLSGCIIHRVIIRLRRLRRTTHVARMG